MHFSKHSFRALSAALLATAALADPVVSTYPLGANVVPAAQGGGVVFKVWAPNAQTVRVAGTFNAWNQTANPLTKDAGTGIWSTWVPTATLGQEYKFRMNLSNGTDTWRIDPRTRRSIDTTGNSIISGDGSTYNWQATNWQTPDHDRMFIYELHVGTFSGNGDGVTNYPAKYRDAVDAHVDELVALGVNMVELLPIHEFPATSWGYNPVHFYAPESSHGSPDDLRYLVDKLHQNGIGVILDVVYNHTSNSDNNLWNFDGPNNVYFFGDICQGQTPWGATRPKYTDANVRAFIIDNVKYWMREFRLDGIRVDSTANMRGYCNEQGEGWLTMGDVTDAAKSINPRAILIAEELPNTAVVTDPRNQGGAGYNAQWCDKFTDTFRAELVKYNTGGNLNMGNIADAIANTGWGGSNLEAVKYVESHDEVGNDDRIVKIIDNASQSSPRAKNIAKVAGAVTLLSPGIPMFMQGQEFLENKRFGDGQGDRMWWGFLTANGGIRDFFGDVAALRTTRGSLRAASACQVSHVNDGADVVGFRRSDANGDVTYVIANFGTQNFPSYNVGVPSTGTWYEIITSDAVEYLGSGVANAPTVATAQTQDGQPARLTIKLPPQSVLIFSKTPIVTVTPKPIGWMVR